MTRYEVVQAKSVDDAVAESQRQLRDLAKCVQVTAVANNVAQGTYSVFPEFERVDIVGDLEVKEGG